MALNEAGLSGIKKNHVKNRQKSLKDSGGNSMICLVD